MFEAIQRIGKGSSCQVYTVLSKSDNKLYAIKESSSKENEDIIKNEVSIFKHLNNESPYIIHFYDFLKGKVKIINHVYVFNLNIANMEIFEKF